MGGEPQLIAEGSKATKELLPVTDLANNDEPEMNNSDLEVEFSDDAGDLQVEGAYDASEIQVLEGLEAVRMRPGMYIGSTGERGLHHLVYEIVDNAVDESLAGYCDHITVELLDGGGCRVQDNGRGIPVSIHPTEGVSSLTLVLTVLHAGGKFGNGGYKVSGGLHGVGSSVVNALSGRMIADIRRDGHHWRQSFTLGAPDGELEKLEETNETGSTITFFPSADIFETTNFNYETLATRFREMAFLNKGLKIEITDRRSNHIDDQGEPIHDEFKFDNGLVDYVRYINANRDVLTSVIDVEAHSNDLGMGLELAMQWNTGYGNSLHTFANTINTHEGGTHEEGLRAALTTTVNKWGETWGLIRKKEDRVGNEDIREGLTDPVSQDDRASVRRPDEDQAGKYRSSRIRPKSGERTSGRLDGAKPQRG